ncbi:MAG TPA: secondary thiamine-phosphate synthase enzyme YjbQ [Spirochaetia bacterium]|nr:secondary thiamine-phosphate synthase enzyme YjbQ [Spirochaetia bacterium]
MVKTGTLTIDTDGGFSTFVITEEARRFVADSGIREGSFSVFLQHTTGSVMIVEHEAGFLLDLEDVLERLVPIEGPYMHHLVGYDRNGAIHVRSALLSQSVMVPVHDRRLLLGTYQDIMVLDMQRERSPRSLVLQVMGE